MGTVVMTCGCSHAFQDAEHGKGRRVFNVRGGKSTVAEGRCTVCLTVKLVQKGGAK